MDSGQRSRLRHQHRRRPHVCPNLEVDRVPRSSTLDIPPEIWGKIADFSTLSTKKQLCCVSLSFRILGTQRLYREVVLEGVDQALKCCKTLRSNPLAAQSVRIFSVVLPSQLGTTKPYPRFFKHIAETLSTCRGIEELSITCSPSSLYARKVHIMIQNITFPDLTSVHFATPIQPVVLYAFLDRHRHTLRSAQLTYPDKEDTQLDNERQEGGKFALKQLDGPAQIIMPLLSWVDAPFLSQLALSFSSGDAPDLVLSDVNNAWRPLNVDELHLDLTFYQKQDSVLKGLLTCFSDVVSLRLSTYFDLDLAELMCKNISSFRRLRVLVFNSTPDHAITRYTGDEHAMVIRLGTACPSLQTCQIWTCPIWKRVVDGVWVPGKDSIDAGIFMLEMLSRRHSLAVKRLLQHLDSYSQVVPEVTETIKHFQKADNPVDETVMKDLLRLGQKLGFWDYAEAFYFSFKYVPPQHRPALRPPVPQRTVSVADMFSNEFMQSVASQLEDFETGLFRPDGDINFERDFGQWFNHPDDIAGLEMR